MSITKLTYLTHMDINISKVIFYIPKVIKNTTKLLHAQPIKLKAYNKDESICAVRAGVENTKVTEKIRKSENIIVSYHKHNPVTTLHKLSHKVREANTQSSRDQHLIVYIPLYKTFEFIKDIHERAVFDRYCEKRKVEININI